MRVYDATGYSSVDDFGVGRRCMKNIDSVGCSGVRRVIQSLRLSLLALPVVALATQAVAGPITTVNQIEAFLGSDKTKLATAHNGTTYITYDATGIDKLVVCIGLESGFNNQKVTDVTLSYNGVSMTRAAWENTIFDTTPPLPGDFDGGAAAIFYLDNPYQGSASFTVGSTMSGGSANGGHVSIIGLQGTADGAGNTSASWTSLTSASTVSTTLTTSGNDAMVIAMVENSGRNSGAGTPTAVTPLILSNNGSWGSQWGSAASAYQEVTASGTTITPTFNTNAGGNIHVVAVEFLPVPEPASLSLSLIALGGVLFARRRRA
jgi:hypothetical protein